MNDIEKMMNEFQKYVEQHGGRADNEKDMDKLFGSFVSEYNANLPQSKNAAPQTAYDYLDLAKEATSPKKKQEYLQKAVELDPDNVDVQLELIITSPEKKPCEHQKALENLIAKETKKLEKEGYFEDAGMFWGILETRPYMRLRMAYLDLLIHNGMIRCAINEGNELLRLCENDNLGVRYQMMSLYALMEDEENALKLHEKFENYDETQMLLPLAILYYKLNQSEKAAGYLKRLSAVNKDTKSFLTDLAKDRIEDMLNGMDDEGYIADSYGELQECLNNSMLLFASVPKFATWAVENLPKRATRSKKK